MKTALAPKTVYRKVLRNEIKMIEGIEILLSIIEKSENNIARLESLDILLNLNTQHESVFKTLENCVISDESEEIRITSAKIISKNFLPLGKKCLEWALLNDTSSKLLKILGKLLIDKKSNQFEMLYVTYLQRLKKIAKRFDIVSEEVIFLLDLEFNIATYNSFNWSSNSTLIYDDDVMFRVQGQHILELSISRRDQVPASIKLLKNLKILDLSYNNLTSLPKSISDLPNLESLDLSWNDFKLFPTVLNEIKSIEKVNFHHNLNDQHPN
jgi:Leucine-rich repeat (LRR) protein